MYAIRSYYVDNTLRFFAHQLNRFGIAHAGTRIQRIADMQRDVSVIVCGRYPSLCVVGISYNFV